MSIQSIETLWVSLFRSIAILVDMTLEVQEALKRNGLQPKTIFLGNSNHETLGTIISIVFDFQGMTSAIGS